MIFMVRNNSTFGSYARPNNWQGLCDQQCHGLVEFPASGLQIGNTAFVSDFNIKKLFVDFMFVSLINSLMNITVHLINTTCALMALLYPVPPLITQTIPAKPSPASITRKYSTESINLNVDQILLRSELLIWLKVHSDPNQLNLYFRLKLWLNRMSCLTFDFVFYFHSVLLLCFHSLRLTFD